MRILTFFLAAIVAALQLAKGLSLQAWAYPQMAFLFTYADGPVRRGLLPSLFSLAGIQNIPAALVWMHLAGLLLLVVVLLSWLWRRQGFSVWLVLASAVLPCLAAMNGYFDVYLVLGLIGTAALLRKRRALLAALLVFVLTLQHEFMLVLALPLFIAELWLERASRKSVLYSLTSLLIAGAAFFIITAQHQPSLQQVAVTRCAEARPDSAQARAVWDRYCERQMNAGVSSDFTPLRALVLPFFLLAYGGLGLCLIVMLVMQGGAAPLRVVGLLGLMLLPLGLVSIAWDADRIIILSSITAWLLFERWSEIMRVRSVSNPVAGYALALLVLVQLPLSYPAMDVYGTYRLVPPATERAWLIDPRSWTLPLLRSNGLKVPVLLDPMTCIDPRCKEL